MYLIFHCIFPTLQTWLHELLWIFFLKYRPESLVKLTFLTFPWLWCHSVPPCTCFIIRLNEVCFQSDLVFLGLRIGSSFGQFDIQLLLPVHCRHCQVLNHRIGWVGRGLKDRQVPAPSHGQRCHPLDQVTQEWWRFLTFLFSLECLNSKLF